MKRIKTIKACTFICLIMGISFLIACIFIFINVHNFVKNGEETTATIISITISGSGDDERHIVEVEYFVNDIKYINSIGYYDSRMMEGQSIPIIFLPNNPNQIIYGDNEYLPFWMFFGVGASSSIIGLVLLLELKKRLKNSNLNDDNMQMSGVEIKKITVKNYILLSIPVVSTFYAMFRMLFLISEHFDSIGNFFGKKFWKFWFSCMLIMLASFLISSPLYIVTHLLSSLNSEVLLIIFSLLIFISWGYSIYFLTNYVIKKTKSIKVTI